MADQLETDFIIKRKLISSLEGAGASLDSIVKAQVYLSDRDDVPGFNEVWLVLQEPAANHDRCNGEARLCDQRSAHGNQYDFAGHQGQD
jgi:hypothetical protein